MVRLIALTFIAIFVMATMSMGAGALLGSTDAATQKTATPVSSQPFKNEDIEASALVIDRDNAGHFTLTAQINGQNTNFLIDTGADAVAITVDEAERLGLPVDPANFEPLLQTASGTGYGTIIEVDELSVAGIELRNIEVVVLDGLETNLLGQPALRRLGKVELHGDRMIIGGS
jgi:aspartyl protease family protein